MAIRLEKEELPRLVEILSGHLPSSLKLYGSLVSTMKRGFPQEFWVDQWPGVTSITAKKVKQDGAYSSYHTLFSINKGSHRRLLDTPGVVDWAEPVMFAALPMEDLSTVEEVARKQNSIIRQETPSLVDLYYMEKADSAKQLDPPNDLTLGTLSREHAQIVKDSWKFGFEEPLSFFETLIQEFPNVCLFGENGNLAAFEMMMFNGSMGLLFVQPRHRKKGLARYLTNTLAQKVLAMGETPYVFIERENEASIRLHESAGFQKVSGSPMFWVEVIPKSML